MEKETLRTYFINFFECRLDLDDNKEYQLLSFIKDFIDRNEMKQLETNLLSTIENYVNNDIQQKIDYDISHHIDCAISFLKKNFHNFFFKKEVQVTAAAEMKCGVLKGTL